MATKEGFPWYLYVFGHGIVLILTYIVFLLAALAVKKAYFSHKYERLMAAQDNTATVAFRPLRPYFRVLHGKRTSYSVTRVYSGLAGENSTGTETHRTELAWNVVKSQLASHLGVTEPELDPLEVGIYKKLAEPSAWRISSSGEPIKVKGRDSTNDAYINDILRKIDTVPPYPGSLPTLEVKYLKQYPRMNEDKLVRNSASDSLNAVFLLSPFFLIMGFIFFRFMPFPRLPSLMATASFFLFLLFTAEYHIIFLTKVSIKTGFLQADLFLYQDGVLREIGKGDA